MNMLVSCYDLPCYVNSCQQIKNVEFLKEKFGIPICYYLNKPFKMELLNKKMLLYSTSDLNTEAFEEHIYFYKLLLYYLITTKRATN